MKAKAKAKERGGTGRGRGDEDEDEDHAIEEGAKPYCEWLDVCHDEVLDCFGGSSGVSAAWGCWLRYGRRGERRRGA